MWEELVFLDPKALNVVTLIGESEKKFLGELISTSKKYYSLTIDPSQILSATEEDVQLEFDKLYDLKSLDKRCPLIHSKIHQFDLSKEMREQIETLVDHCDKLKFKFK